MNSPEQPDEPGAQDERTGPLHLQRLSKADGRALILYSTMPEHE